MTILRGDYSPKRKRRTSARKKKGNAPLCPRCKRSITGFVVPRVCIQRDSFGAADERSKRFSHRGYHPSCSDIIRLRAVRIIRKRETGA